ncbi:hypothetical protein BDZ89DRAFT_1049180 [Hymenopellis radicata]|nr:hypothetical protein BDZ89DRAFT_1049180 [Hymenopellis radicata]
MTLVIVAVPTLDWIWSNDILISVTTQALQMSRVPRISKGTLRTTPCLVTAARSVFYLVAKTTWAVWTSLYYRNRHTTASVSTIEASDLIQHEAHKPAAEFTFKGGYPTPLPAALTDTGWGEFPKTDNILLTHGPDSIYKVNSLLLVIHTAKEKWASRDESWGRGYSYGIRDPENDAAGYLGEDDTSSADNVLAREQTSTKAARSRVLILGVHAGARYLPMSVRPVEV